MESIKVVDLLGKATATVTGKPYDGTWNANRRVKVQGIITGSGSVSATILVKGSNNGVNYETLGTISLSGTNTDSDTVDIDYPWAYVLADLTAISGTSAKAEALLSI